MWSQRLRCIIICHAMILDKATTEAVVRVKTAVIAFPLSMASSGERAPGLVAMAETVEDSSKMLFCAAAT